MTELTWFKSSHSSNEDAACVEVAWRKSTYSSNEGAQCVEVAETPGTVHLRDSKDKTGPQLTFEPAAWKAFIDFAANADV
ncbi:protein of unknown function [Streptomyces sp. TLI_053]|uniref:DUF397 domain-containing protein n=1 Tax=Streptomyces sp. TLI_053 TaxID=1855352 RepID=UPI00087A7724|nr:DUF397 domain-containing protein [Streptomyces sp. TLI_053]SDT80651.1 protein of unknown function [Streptomyces sp. TLI_053]